MRRGLVAALAAVTALLLAGCGLFPAPAVTSTPDPSGAPAGLERFYGQSLVWKDCGGGFRCATASAPLDWDAPGGDRIRLALTMRPASGDRIGTLFTNPGGPGVSGVDFLRSSATRFFDRTLLEHYDLVAWDPRGVGHSSAVDCYGTPGLDRFLFSDPDLPEGSSALRRDVERSSVAFGRACARNTGPLLAHVGTADTVRDLDMLRAAEGERKLDYFGFSYGTLIGVEYAGRYPTRVGRMVLDGQVDPALTSFDKALANARSFGSSLKAYLADCLRGSDCPFRGETVGGATGEIVDLLLALRKSPLRAADGRTVNSAVLLTAIDAALYDPGSWSVLSEALARVLGGDPSLVQSLSDGYVQRGKDGYEGNEFEAIYAVTCLDAPVTTDSAELRRQGRALTAADPLGRANDVEDLGNTVCANWPVPAESRPAAVHAPGAPPIVILGSTGDPATPYAWARDVAGQLQHAVLLTRVGQGHTAYRSDLPCINDPVDTFLVDGTVPKPVRCG